MGKQRELQAILADLDIELVLPNQVGLADFDVEETGQTLEENARLKAVGFAEAARMATIADDSGLEVAVLDGAPGVFSKRFGSSDDERMSKLLSLTTDATDRSAQFRSVLCFYDPKSRIEHLEEGIVTGRLAFEPRGNNGFGYDPLFIPDGYDKTFAELGVDIKNGISHRARAALELKAWFVTHRTSTAS